MKLNILTLAVVLAGIGLFVQYAFMHPWTPMRAAGFTIVIPSALLLVVARIQLGRAFSVRAKASQLITTGLYSRIRNPIYIFGGLALAGLILYTGQLWLFLALAVLIFMQIRRARIEERVLTEAFGEEYLAYKRKTWF